MFKSKPSIVATAVVLSLGLGGCSSDDVEDAIQDIINTAPTEVALSANTVEENAVAAEIGSLTTSDADADDTHTYTVSDDRFEIVDGMLKLKADMSLNYEAEMQVMLTVTTTDSSNGSFEQPLTIDVTDSVGVQSVIDGLTLPSTYAFDSAFTADASSVSHSGQAARQILLLELNNYISSGLASDVENEVITSGAEAKTKLMSLYAKSEDDWQADKDNDTVQVITAISLETPLTAKQMKITDVSSSHKNLQAKMAGNDTTGQTRDWSTDLVGWNDKGSLTPNGVVEALFDMIAANVDTEIAGSVRNDITGEPITKLYLQEDGTDSKQLIQKFILGALNFSQGTDDYLDHMTDGKGLNSDNMAQDGTKAYTSLEHQFDEGFGYFGAAHNYNDYTDLEIRAKSGRDGWSNGYNDIDADGMIDFTSEINFGNSTNAAKRDVGTADNAMPTDFTKQAFDAFVTGRAIISSAVTSDLTADQMTTLLEQRDVAVLTWEKAIMATVVHYINDVNADLDKLGTDGYSSDDYADLAKHWSELKGFSLNVQFNPHTPMSDEQFAMMQENIGMAPVLTAAEVADYKAKLLEVRIMLQVVYAFDAENVANW